MQADTPDRLDDTPSQGGLPILPIIVAVLLLAAAGFWYFSGSDTPDNAPAAPTTAPIVATTESAAVEPVVTPDVPELVTPEPLTDANTDIEPASEPAVTLDNSDAAMREYFQEVGEDEVLQQSLQGEHLIEVATAVMDAASQGVVLRKLLPLPAPEGAFKVTQMNGKLVMDPTGYERYDTFANALAALDTDTLAGGFHTFRPLLEEAYAALGYKAEDMDNTLIRALDTIIAAPIIEQPIAVEKDITNYTFADSSIEQLSPVAKQLLRMGPKNQALIQQQAAALRSALLGEASSASDL